MRGVFKNIKQDKLPLSSTFGIVRVLICVSYEICVAGHTNLLFLQFAVKFGMIDVMGCDVIWCDQRQQPC